MTSLFNCYILLSFSQTFEFTEVQIISTATGKMTVRVAGEEAATAEAKYSNDDFTEFYVGGIPEALRER